MYTNLQEVSPKRIAQIQSDVKEAFHSFIIMNKPQSNLEAVLLLKRDMRAVKFLVSINGYVDDFDIREYYSKAQLLKDFMTGKRKVEDTFHKIVSAVIYEKRDENEVVVILANGQIVTAFKYSRDELTFKSSEFLGLNIKQARDLYTQKYVACSRAE